MATAVLNEEALPKRWRLRLPERLPDLKGKWLASYTVIWIAVLVAAIASSGYGTVIDHRYRQQTSWNDLGLVALRQGHHRMVQAVFTEEARRGGVSSGDVIVALNGVSVSDVSSRQIVRRLADTVGKYATLTIQHPNGQMRRVRLSVSRANADQRFAGAGVNAAAFEFEQIMLDIALPLFWVAAAALLFLRRRGQIVPSLLSLAFLSIPGCVFAGGDALAAVGLPLPLVDTFNTASWGFLLIGMVSFPDGRFEPRWSALIFLTPCSFSGLGEPTKRPTPRSLSTLLSRS